MPPEFDRCVRKVIGQGRSQSSAFAICTAAFKRAGKETENFQMKEKLDEQKEVKLDEDGDIIVAENVQFVINSDISVVKE